MQVTFRNKLEFDASSSYLRNPARSKSSPAGTGPNAVQLRALRGVNFAPRYHQRSLTSPRFLFRDKKFCHISPSYSDILWPIRKYHSDKVQSNAPLAHSHSSTKRLATGFCFHNYSIDRHSSQRDFQRMFRPKRPKDDLEKKARDWRAFLQYPYTNPKPHNFRPLDEDIPDTALRTLQTPDPFDIRFKTAALTDDYKEVYAAGPIQFTSRDVSFKFRTFKTPEPHFDPRLLREKGRYSPAFTAHNAYLDRIAKTISED